MRAREFIVELNMAPGNLQKQVDKLISSAAPQFGMEFEIVVPIMHKEDDEIHRYTTLKDIAQNMQENYDIDSDRLSKVNEEYFEWYSDKRSEWEQENIMSIIDAPKEEADKKIEIMTDLYAVSQTASESLLKIGDQDEEITEEIAKEVIMNAYKRFVKEGPVSGWDEESELENPYTDLYVEVFIDDSSQAIEEFNDVSEDDFNGIADDDAYSFGTYMIEDKNIKSIVEMYSEYILDIRYDPKTMDFESTADSLGNGLSEIAGDYPDIAVSPDALDDTASNWGITADDSIEVGDEETGIELITPILEYTSGISTVKQVIDYLTSSEVNAYTNKSTGLHINVSMENIDHNKVDYVKLVLLLGDKHVLQSFNREFNSFAVSSLEYIRDELDIHTSTGYSRDQPEKVLNQAELMTGLRKNISNAIETSFIDIDFGKNTSVGLKADRIEFRAGGGANYLENFDHIVQTLNRFIVAYAAAADPNAYRKEYGKKLYKMAMGSGTDDSNIIKIFAGFNSGLISKEELITTLKRKHRKKSDPQYDRNSGENGPELIMQAYNISKNEASKLFTNGITFEIDKNDGKQADEIVEIVLDNIINNGKDYYK